MNHSGVTHKIKDCVAKLVNNKSDSDMANEHPDKSGKWSVKLRMFYNNNFPTDKDSYAVRLPVVSLALSLCAIQIFLNLMWREPREGREFFLWAIMVVLSAATYGLYYGIKIGDRKQFTPWIIFKIMEVIVTSITVISTLMDGYFMYSYRFLRIILGFVVIAGNIFLLSIICHRKRDDFDDVQENVDEFSPVMSAA